MSSFEIRYCTAMYCRLDEVGGGGETSQNPALFLVGVRVKPAVLLSGVRNKVGDDIQKQNPRYWGKCCDKLKTPVLLHATFARVHH